MEPRLNLHTNDFAVGFYKRFNAAGRVITDSTLSMTIQHLVKLRASQINGCGFCTDMHSKEATHEGETAQRLNLVAAWRDATVFTPAERAALALAEEGTRIADGDTGVPDAVWADAREHFDDDELAALVCVIAMINAYNRLSVITALPAGNYEPGQFG